MGGEEARGEGREGSGGCLLLNFKYGYALAYELSHERRPTEAEKDQLHTAQSYRTTQSECTDRQTDGRTDAVCK